MEERLVRERNRGLNTTGLRTWALLFLVLSAAGRALLQNRLLELTGTTDLMAALDAEGGMLMATIALILVILESCATPLFAYLLVEGAKFTGNLNKYLLRVGALALVTEIPFNFAMSGKLVDLSTRNPVFGMLLALVLIWFYKKYEGKSAKAVMIKIMVTLAAMVWAVMLSVEHGGASLLIVVALWAFRNKPNLRNLMGGCATMLCCLYSITYLAAPMGFLLIHFYNGEKGPSRQTFHYLVYPAALLVIGIIGKFFL